MNSITSLEVSCLLISCQQLFLKFCSYYFSFVLLYFTCMFLFSSSLFLPDRSISILVGFLSVVLSGSLFLLISFVLASFCLFLLSNSSELDFVLSFLILFYCYSIEGCLYFNERLKVNRPRWEGQWKGTGGSRGRGHHNQDILCRKKLFSIKEIWIKEYIFLVKKHFSCDL